MAQAVEPHVVHSNGLRSKAAEAKDILRIKYHINHSYRLPQHILSLVSPGDHTHYASLEFKAMTAGSKSGGKSPTVGWDGIEGLWSEKGQYCNGGNDDEDEQYKEIQALSFRSSHRFSRCGTANYGALHCAQRDRKSVV